MKVRSYRCGYCGGRITDAPVPIEAICWRCWWREYGEADAVRMWRSKHWWRRLVP